MNILVGDRSEAYRLPLNSRRDIYARPAYHPEDGREPVRPRDPRRERLLGALGLLAILGIGIFAGVWIAIH